MYYKVTITIEDSLFSLYFVILVDWLGHFAANQLFGQMRLFVLV